MSRTDGACSPAPGRSFAAPARTPGWPAAGGEPASRSPPTTREPPTKAFWARNSKGAEMKGKTTKLKAALVLVGILAVTATTSLSVASATNHKPAFVPPDSVLTWNTYTVNAVRASIPTKVQTDGMVYMSYVQAAVYDAVTKLEGRYQPYHDFAFAVVPGS